MQEPGNSRLFYRPRKVPGKFTGASRNTLSVPIKFPGNGPGKLTGPVITGSFEKRAPGPARAFFTFAHSFAVVCKTST